MHIPFGPIKNMKKNKKQPLNRFDPGACVQRRRHNHYTTVSSNVRYTSEYFMGSIVHYTRQL